MYDSYIYIYIHKCISYQHQLKYKISNEKSVRIERESDIADNVTHKHTHTHSVCMHTYTYTYTHIHTEHPKPYSVEFRH